MRDTLLKKRTLNGMLQNEWFWNHSDISEIHKKNLKELYQLEDNSVQYQLSLMDFWKLHDDAVLFQGVWHFPETNEDLYTVMLSLAHQSWFEVSYIVIPWAQCDWFEYVKSRQWSPLQWWLANREEETKSLMVACERHLSAIDWHLGGVPLQSLHEGPLNKLLSLSNGQKKPTYLSEQSWLNLSLD